MISLRTDKTYANPVFGGYFADPFVFRANGRYFAVGTGPCLAQDPPRELPMLCSDNLREWEPLEGAIRRTAPGHYWAPEVAQADGVYFMYFSVGVSDERHELRVAVSSRPEGPYEVIDEPVLDPRTASFAIDASPFLDEHGQWWLFYARDFLDSDDGARPGTALVVAPLLDMRRIPDDFHVVMRARHDWQRYQPSRPMYGGVYDWHTLEGAAPVWHEGRYYCLYSGGNWQNDTYGIDFVSADRVDGAWTDSNDGTGPRVLRTVPGHVIGPGHNSIFTSESGDHVIAYHAWDTAMTARRLCLDPLVWTAGGPRGRGPTWTPQKLS